MRVANICGMIYFSLFIFMAIVVFNGPIIQDPQYPDSSEIITGGVIIGFMALFVWCFLPLLLILNFILYIKTKRGLQKSAGNVNN